MTTRDDAWRGARPRKLGAEELAPMALAWGRGRPIRCSRCGRGKVEGTVTRDPSGALTLRLECLECAGWGTCTVPGPGGPGPGPG